MGRVQMIAVCAALLAGASGVATGQQHAQDSRAYFDYGEPFYTAMTHAPDGRSVDVRVNTASAMFSFLRSESARELSHGQYYAIRQVTFEVVDKNSNETVQTKNVIDTIYVPDYKSTTAKDQWHALDQRVELPALSANANYGLRLEIRDGVLSRPAMRPMIADLHPQSFSSTADSNGIAIGDVILFDTVQGARAFTKARGNTYMFSRDVNGAVSFLVADKLPAGATVDLVVRQISNLIDPQDTGMRSRVTVPIADLHADSAMTFTSAGTGITYTLAPSTSNTGGKIYTAFFTIPGQKFEQGRYQFTVRVTAGAAMRSHSNEVNILWQDMPLSLEDPVDAIQPLAHILSDEQVREIKAGNKQDMMSHLYQYWRKQDPTPATAYNERMAAFYERVDYADFNFASTRMLDGVMTDRGRVYLLYGAPTNVERTFLPGEAPVETWTYSNNVKRIFRFEDHGGQYKLTDVKNVATN